MKMVKPHKAQLLQMRDSIELQLLRSFAGLHICRQLTHSRKSSTSLSLRDALIRMNKSPKLAWMLLCKLFIKRDLTMLRIS